MILVHNVSLIFLFSCYCCRFVLLASLTLQQVIQFSPEKLQAGGGSGFGLFITKSIVDLHEGTIGVYSAGEGKGTRFTLELPMSRTIAVENNQSNINRPMMNTRNRSTALDQSLMFTRSHQSFPYDAAAGIPEPPLSPTSVGGGGGHSPTFSKGDNHPPSPSSNDIAFPPGNGRKGNLMLREISRRDMLNPQTGSMSYKLLNDKRKSGNKRGVYLGSPMMSQHSHRSRSPEASAAMMPDAADEVRSPVANGTSSVVGPTPPVAPVNALTVVEQDVNVPASPKWDILVVDDSPLNRKMLMKTLRAAGHTCEEAGDGREGVVMVQRRVDNSATPYDVILMDFVMPVMNGPTATKVHKPYTQHNTRLTHPLTSHPLTTHPY